MPKPKSEPIPGNKFYPTHKVYPTHKLTMYGVDVTNFSQHDLELLDTDSKLPNNHLYHDIQIPHTPWGGDKADYFSWFNFLSGIDSYARGTAGGEIKKEFHYIQLHEESFLRNVAPHISRRTRSFIDVGCGGGDKLEIVKRMFPWVWTVGIEHDPTMAIWAGTVADHVFCDDAFKISYRPYDIIYAYWPICDTELMVKLAWHIVTTKKTSAKFILMGFKGYCRDSDLRKHILFEGREEE